MHFECVIGSSPGSFRRAVGTAANRALRTLLQGLAAAFVAAAPATQIFAASYWQGFGYACLTALFTAIASFLMNAATFLPDDPTQTTNSSAQARSREKEHVDRAA